MNLLLPKGMRDIDPVDKILQTQVLDVIREVFELYGYLPLETPLVERMDILTAKFAAGSGSDVMKEIFKVEDQGGRGLGLRYDHTVPLCRYVAMNPNIKLPFKRYAIGKVYRDGPIKLGRYREFWQADADIIGVPGVMGDVEGVMMVADVFERLKLDVVVKIGSREILNLMMTKAGIASRSQAAATIALDKLEKIGEAGVLAEMKTAGVENKQAKVLLKLAKVSGTNVQKLDVLEKQLGSSEATLKMREIVSMLKHLKNVEFTPSLARGLSYYTGFVYECFLRGGKKGTKHCALTASLIGSGRYDRMIGSFLGGSREYPGVGLSFGVSVICDALREKGVPLRRSLTEVYVVAVSEKEKAYALQVANKLRANGIRTDMDLMGRGMSKNFSYADALEIPYVIVLGEEERKGKKCTLKDMRSGKQHTLEMDRVVSVIASAAKQS